LQARIYPNPILSELGSRKGPLLAMRALLRYLFRGRQRVTGVESIVDDALK